MTVREPEWTARDRALALAWQADDRMRCPGCGLSRVETTRREAQGRWKVEQFYCHACAPIQAAQRHNRESYNGPSDGLYLTLRERDG